MRVAFVVTFAGADRRGLIHHLSQLLAAHEGNWEESRLARLADKCVGILKVVVDQDRAAGLCAALSELESEQFSVTIDRSPDATTAAADRVGRLAITSADHEGIVRDISAVLTSRGVQIDELSSEVFAAPMSGQMTFRATADFVCPSSVSPDVLHRELEQLADDLMVEITFKAGGAA